ncbi:hypothetical protein BLOT_012571 [Blomia tropicalis]|nr:hypothetical protein BLOT_012571 [Blomia tropicalis]
MKQNTLTTYCITDVSTILIYISEHGRVDYGGGGGSGGGNLKTVYIKFSSLSSLLQSNYHNEWLTLYGRETTQIITRQK